MFVKLDEALKATLRKFGLKSKIEEARIFKHWEEVVGQRVALHTKPVVIKNRTLFINTSSPTWAHELNYIKKDIIDEINHFLGRKVIIEIRFQSGEMLNKKESGEESVHALLSQETNLKNKDLKEIENLVKTITDEKIKSRLKSVLIKDRKLKIWKQDHN